MSRRERLSALDASFLYIESKTTPNHGALVSMVDGPVDFDRIKSKLGDKLSLLVIKLVLHLDLKAIEVLGYLIV